MFADKVEMIISETTIIHISTVEHNAVIHKCHSKNNNAMNILNGYLNERAGLDSMMTNILATTQTKLKRIWIQSKHISHGEAAAEAETPRRSDWFERLSFAPVRTCSQVSKQLIGKLSHINYGFAQNIDWQIKFISNSWEGSTTLAQRKSQNRERREINGRKWKLINR